MLDDAQRLDWLRLIRSENVGPITFRDLINRYGSAAAALEAIPELSRRGGRTRALRVCARDAAEAELAAAQRLGASCVAWGEPGYPKLLGFIDGAPPLLYVTGYKDAADRPIVGIVGSRDASAGGRRIARQMAESLGEQGYTTVSGLARGIDAACHEGSLQTGTIAVLPGGVGKIYPENHVDLAGRIRQRGLIVSENPPDFAPRGRDFPRRNRIISGMSIGVVVVEAALRSGSRITGRLAAEQGREVFAVPGSPLDPRSEGTNQLIRDGAVLARSAADVLEVIRALSEPDQSPAAPDHAEEPQAEEMPVVAASDRARVLEALSASAIEIDIVVRETGLSASAVTIALLELELAGKIERMPGARAARIV